MPADAAWVSPPITGHARPSLSIASHDPQDPEGESADWDSHPPITLAALRPSHDTLVKVSGKPKSPAMTSQGAHGTQHHMDSHPRLGRVRRTLRSGPGSHRGSAGIRGATLAAAAVTTMGGLAAAWWTARAVPTAAASSPTGPAPRHPAIHQHPTIPTTPHKDAHDAPATRAQRRA
jgi:hypothetical protein